MNSDGYRRWPLQTTKSHFVADGNAKNLMVLSMDQVYISINQGKNAGWLGCLREPTPMPNPFDINSLFTVNAMSISMSGQCTLAHCSHLWRCKASRWCSTSLALQTSRQLKGLEHPVDRDRLTSGATRTASSSLQGVHLQIREYGDDNDHALILNRPSSTLCIFPFRAFCPSPPNLSLVYQIEFSVGRSLGAVS